MKHGELVHPPDGDLGPFAPGGEPEKLSDRGAADPGADQEFDAALREFSGLKRGRKLGGLRSGPSKITVPLESQEKSTYNKPPVG